MILVDRIGLVWLLFCIPLVTILPPDVKATPGIVMAGVALLALPPWLLLRGLDFIVTGRVRGKQ